MSSISYLFLFFLFAIVDCRANYGTLLQHESNRAETLSWSSCGICSNILASPEAKAIFPDFLPLADLTLVALPFLVNEWSSSILNLVVFNGLLV